MTNTPHLNITLVSQAQSQKEVTINLAFQILEMLQNTNVKSMALSTPPGSPAEGDLYVVKATGTGAWASQDGNFAYFINGTWLFIPPLNGVAVWNAATTTLLVYSSGSWINPVTALSNPNFATLGVNATPDSTNKLAVSSSAILFNNIGNDCKVYVNKNATGDGASFIFETNFSERAEFGCIGDDNFQLKVSPDGSTFYQSWVIDKSSGNVDFKQLASFEKGIQVKEGSNLFMGTATLVGGTVTVSNTAVTSTSRIFLTIQSAGGTLGTPYISARIAGTSFTISSTSVIDTSVVAWQIVNPA